MLDVGCWMLDVVFYLEIEIIAPIRNLKSAIPNPQSAIPNPQSQIPDFNISSPRTTVLLLLYALASVFP